MDKTKAIVNKTVMTINGALYEKSIVVVEEINAKEEKARVTDEMGRIFWLQIGDISIINP